MPTAIAPTEDARTRADPGDSGAGPVRLGVALHESASRYDVLRELGRGGMGEVLLCFDRRIGRQVAMKRSTVAVAANPEADRFLREISVQGQLEHPTVVPLHDLSVDPDGQVYFTMKHVRGRTLKNILSALREGDKETREQFPLRKLLAAIVNVCLGVAFAHSRGVIHRDLKPDNLMLGAFGEVYVLDWGVAKVVTAPDLPDLLRVPGHGAEAGGTEAGSLVGTPGYMSPEQCRGDVDGIGPASDVYALGAILFELLAQTPLHAGTALDKVHSTLDGADARVHLRAPALEPMPELEAICVLATATDPERRLASAREMSARIDAYLNHDWDVELRRQLAATHAAAAEAASERVLGPGAKDMPEDRQRGLSEAGRALALDPGNELAMRVMLRLLTAPPHEPPPEVQVEEEEMTSKRRRVAMRVSMYVHFLFVGVALLNIASGVSSWAWYAVYLGPVPFCALATLLLLRLPRITDGHLLLGITLDAIALGGLAAATGPLLIVPWFSALVVLTGLLYMDKHRVLAIATGCLPVVLPLVLQWMGLMPPSYSFGDGLVILPRVFVFREVPTVALLLAGGVGMIFGCAFLGSRLRSSVREAERRLSLQAWQLRQLLPSTSGRPGGQS